MNLQRLLFLTVALLAVAAVPAQGHFLFIYVGPPAEAGRTAEVFFSDVADAGDPRFVDKVAHTQLWLQTPGKEIRPLKVHKTIDRLRAFVPMSGTVVVAGSCEYGVLARPKQVPFLLRYYPKAIAGSPAELNHLGPVGKTSLEIVAALEGDQIQLTALHDDKPIPNAEFQTVDIKLANDKVTAGADGRASWKPPAPGRYAVYTHVTTKTPGEVGGKKYDEIREYATLGFTWPIERKDADEKAVSLFEEAIAARAMWKNFPGFRAQIRGEVDGRPFEGKVTIDATGSVHLETAEGAVTSWVTEQLESLAMHRGAGSSSAASTERSRPVLRFADTQEDHPLGRLLIFEGGRFASSYRVKDKQILVVNRHMGKQNMTITVLKNDKNHEGHFIPRSYTVQYWDAASGALNRTETIQDKWQRVSDWDLPTEHTVMTASEGGLTIRTLTLSGHELQKTAASSKAAGGR
jgi:hypothetical protein